MCTQSSQDEVPEVSRRPLQGGKAVFRTVSVRRARTLDVHLPSISRALKAWAARANAQWSGCQTASAANDALAPVQAVANVRQVFMPGRRARH